MRFIPVKEKGKTIGYQVVRKSKVRKQKVKSNKRMRFVNVREYGEKTGRFLVLR